LSVRVCLLATWESAGLWCPPAHSLLPPINPSPPPTPAHPHIAPCRSVLLPVLESVRALWPSLHKHHLRPASRTDDSVRSLFRDARDLRNRLAHPGAALSNAERRDAIALFLRLALVCGAGLDAQCVTVGARLRDVGLQDAAWAQEEARALHLCQSPKKFEVHLRAGAGDYGVVFLVRGVAGTVRWVGGGAGAA
jgi:hypothetical protein